MRYWPGARFRNSNFPSPSVSVASGADLFEPVSSTTAFQIGCDVPPRTTTPSIAPGGAGCWKSRAITIASTFTAHNDSGKTSNVARVSLRGGIPMWILQPMKHLILVLAFLLFAISGVYSIAQQQSTFVPVTDEMLQNP